MLRGPQAVNLRTLPGTGFGRWKYMQLGSPATALNLTDESIFATFDKGRQNFAGGWNLNDRFQLEGEHAACSGALRRIL